jgi:hypothetical protein
MISPEDITYAVYTEADKSENDNILLIKGGIINSGFDYGVYLRLGGNAILKDLQVNSETGLFLGTRENYLFDVMVDALIFNGKGPYAHINNHTEGNKLTHQNFLISEDNNLITTRYGITKNTYLGGRVIIGKVKPTTSVHGLENDIYRLKHPESGVTYEWICTRSGLDREVQWTPLKIAGD